MSADHIYINGHKHIIHKHVTFEKQNLLERTSEYYNFLNSRRSIREFTTDPVSKDVIATIIKSASSAPSGAHKQPWTFCAISNKELKSQIRKAAEIEEQASYDKRMSKRWKEDLNPLGTDSNKPFLEDAPWIIVVFKRVYDHENDEKHNNYYVNESVGIACGLLISAIHNAGLVTLTHTPSPMNFLSKILKRPNNERPFLLLPVGYPKTPVYVPDLHRKGLDEISEFYE